MTLHDPHDLARFVAAQDAHHTYDDALAELRRGQKTSHWMWFVFPQIAGLGHSAMAQKFAIASLEEARAYLAHPVLGARLRECAAAVLGTNEKTAEQILGFIDAKKLHSSLTLFAHAATNEPLFQSVLDRYFGGAHDDETVKRL